MNQPFSRFEDIDWSTWIPVERATLVFIIKGDDILLIEKKRGLGAGKINGPGGRLEPGETPEQCAIRETQEELLITPLNIEAAGELNFQFTDGHSIQGYVYKATDWEGTPTETEEANPMWTNIRKIPYENMWADDAVWMPLMLKNEPFIGKFLFDGDRMVGQRMEKRPANF